MTTAAFTLRGHASTDDICFEYGRYLPDGTFHYVWLERANADALRAKFGDAWLADYLRDARVRIDKLGVH